MQYHIIKKMTHIQRMLYMSLILYRQARRKNRVRMLANHTLYAELLPHTIQLTDAITAIRAFYCITVFSVLQVFFYFYFLIFI